MNVHMENPDVVNIICKYQKQVWVMDCMNNRLEVMRLWWDYVNVTDARSIIELH